MTDKLPEELEYPAEHREADSRPYSQFEVIT